VLVHRCPHWRPHYRQFLTSVLTYDIGYAQSEIFYREDDSVLVRDWLRKLPKKVQKKCLTYIAQLEMQGHDSHRPGADFLRDAIYELRPSYQGVNYRILYFFSGKALVVLSHGITKERAVPSASRRGRTPNDTCPDMDTDAGAEYAKQRRFKSAAIQELYDELIGEDPAAQEEFEEGLVNIEAAQLIHAMRTKAALSQRELARKVGTSASAINRLESADYQGHTIAMVRRIGTALNRRLELRAIPIKTRTAAKARS